MFLAAGKVNGVQLALDSVFSTLSFVAGIFTWNPGAFKWLLFGAVVVVLSSAALYTLGWVSTFRSKTPAGDPATELELNPILN